MTDEPPVAAVATLKHFSVRRHAFALTLGGLVAVLAVIVQQVMDYGYLVTLDYDVHQLQLDHAYPQVYSAMFYLVMIGQRGPAGLVAAAVAGTLAWKFRTWRPALVLAGALLALNLVVGGGKLYTARLKPSEGTAEIFAGGIIFPSGHAADVVISWGIVLYLMWTYGVVRHRRIGVTAVALASLAVGVASIYLDTHWLSDILAGWSVGAIILMVTIRLDRVLSRSERAAGLGHRSRERAVVLIDPLRQRAAALCRLLRERAVGAARVPQRHVGSEKSGSEKTRISTPAGSDRPA